MVNFYYRYSENKAFLRIRGGKRAAQLLCGSIDGLKEALDKIKANGGNNQKGDKMDKVIAEWMVYQQGLLEAGKEPITIELCQGWKPALAITHLKLLQDLQRWMSE